MSTSRPQLAATSRTIVGKKVVQLRRSGTLPGVLFGRDLESRSLSIDAHEFALLRRSIGPNSLVDLRVDEGKAVRVMIHGVQVHPVTGRPLHVDLFQVRMGEDLTADVPVVTVGETRLVSQDEGTLLHALDHVRVRAVPDKLPQRIEVSLEVLTDFDSAIHVRDLPLPAGVTMVTDGDDLVVKVLPPRIEAREEAPEAVEVEVGAGPGAGAQPAEGAAPDETGEEG